jgi:hypothetical protein
MVPSAALDSMNLGAIGGVAGLANVAKEHQAADEGAPETGNADSLGATA